jgi:hypothetical protein
MEPMDIAKLILNMLLLGAASIFLKAVVPYLRTKYQGEQHALINSILDVLVQGAEQMYGAGAGKEKFAAVLEGAKAKGIDVSKEAVEAAVLRLHADGLSSVNVYPDKWKPLIASSEQAKDEAVQTDEAPDSY